MAHVILSATCAWISSLDAVSVTTTACLMRQYWRESVLCSSLEPSPRMWECSTELCWRQGKTSNIRIVDTSTQVNTSLKFYPVQRLKLFSKSTYSSAGLRFTTEWMLQVLFTYKCIKLLLAESNAKEHTQVSWAPSDRQRAWTHFLSIFHIFLPLH